MWTILCSRSISASQLLGLQDSESGFDPVKPLQWQGAPTWRMALLIFTKYFLTHPQAQTLPSGWGREENLFLRAIGEIPRHCLSTSMFSVSLHVPVLATFLQSNRFFCLIKNESVMIAKKEQMYRELTVRRTFSEVCYK